MFGLTGPQGNHGEDVKEYWWYLEGLPSHALLKWRYHYPQAAFPYERARPPRPRAARPRAGAARHGRLRRRPLLVGRRHLREGLADRGADADRAREPRAGRGDDRRAADALVPQHVVVGRRRGAAADRGRRRGARRRRRPPRRLPARGGARARRRAPEALFCENETNAPRVFGSDATTPYPKDGINDHVVSGAATVNPDGLRHEGRAPLPRDRARRRQGRAAAEAAPAAAKKPAASWAATAFDEVVAAREADADEFYAALAPEGTDAEHDADPPPVLRRARLEQADVPVQRAPLARRRPGRAGAARRRAARAATPAGATSTRSTCSRCPTRGSTRGSRRGTSASTASRGRTSIPAFAKYQLLVLLREWFQHPNGALPAYEWNFDDVNPPVHVMAALRVFVIDGATRPRVPRAGLPEAADQLHVVAQPRGRRRQQRLQRRLPRPRQHQPDRPLEPAARASRSSRPTARRGWPTTRSRCS